MDILILAAGFGTRLYPLTINQPKALIEVNNKPILEHTIEKLLTLNPENIYLLSNNKFYTQFQEWAKIYSNPKIKLFNNKVNLDKEKLGAVRDLKNTLNRINSEELLVLASDNLFDFNLEELYNLTKETNRSSVALINIEDKELIKKYSNVLLDDKNRITFFEEKPRIPRSNIVATSFYMLTKQDLEKIKHHDFENYDNMGNLIEFLHKDSIVYGKIFTDLWMDIGSKEELEKANEIFKTRN